jgi:hypothetical protein
MIARSVSVSCRRALLRSSLVVWRSSRSVKRDQWGAQLKSHTLPVTLPRSCSRASCRCTSRGRCRAVATALGQARHSSDDDAHLKVLSRNDTAHGPAGVNGLCS